MTWLESVAKQRKLIRQLLIMKASIHVFFIALLLALVSGKLYASAQTDFEQGVMFFKQGKYAQAIEQFESAQKQGLDTISLAYNLASSYFKLGNYDQARHYFQLVAKTPKMHDLAMYNLGLVAIKQQQATQARTIFTRIVEQSSDKKLIALSATQLSNLQRSQDDWRLYVSAEYGHDSNITSLPSETSLDIADNFYLAFISIDKVVSGSRNNGWLLDARFFRIDFSDSDSFDEYQYAVGIKKNQSIANWSTRLQLGLSRNNFAGDDYQSTVKVALDGRTRLSRNQQLYLRYQYEDISSEQAIYDYLQGWRQRARIGLRQKNNRHDYNIYYELELNQRNDLITSSYAYEYSPTRHTLRGIYSYQATENWKLIAELGLRDSDFPSSESFDRDDEQLKSALGIDYAVNKSLHLKGRLEHINNSSSVELYDYSKNRIMLGLNKLF
jgi:Tfp pilus assembly protein PilF